MKRELFKIEIGQYWRVDGEVYHVPRQEKELEPHEFEVIRCFKEKTGWHWVFPREAKDAPIWNLSNFQEAELFHD